MTRQSETPFIYSFNLERLRSRQALIDKVEDRIGMTGSNFGKFPQVLMTILSGSDFKVLYDSNDSPYFESIWDIVGVTKSQGAFNIAEAGFIDNEIKAAFDDFNLRNLETHQGGVVYSVSRIQASFRQEPISGGNIMLTYLGGEYRFRVTTNAL